MIRGPARFWGKDMLWYILTACVILYNMIIENERDDADVGGYDYDQDGGEELTQEEYQRRNPNVMSEFLRIHKKILWSICGRDMAQVNYFVRLYVS
jgi:hypothetical protein